MATTELRCRIWPLFAVVGPLLLGALTWLFLNGRGIEARVAAAEVTSASERATNQEILRRLGRIEDKLDRRP